MSLGGRLNKRGMSEKRKESYEAHSKPVIDGD